MSNYFNLHDFIVWTMKLLFFRTDIPTKMDIPVSAPHHERVFCMKTKAMDMDISANKLPCPPFIDKALLMKIYDDTFRSTRHNTIE